MISVCLNFCYTVDYKYFNALVIEYRIPESTSIYVFQMSKLNSVDSTHFSVFATLFKYRYPLCILAMDLFL